MISFSGTTKAKKQTNLVTGLLLAGALTQVPTLSTIRYRRCYPSNCNSVSEEENERRTTVNPELLERSVSTGRRSTQKGNKQS